MASLPAQNTCTAGPADSSIQWGFPRKPVRFIAIAYVLSVAWGTVLYLALMTLGFLGITLRVSYHVYYQTSFLHLQQQYSMNRITEEIRAEDLLTDRLTLRLQRMFLLLYGWQDRLMGRIDMWCRKRWAQDSRTRLVCRQDRSAPFRISGIGNGVASANGVLAGKSTYLVSLLQSGSDEWALAGEHIVPEKHPCAPRKVPRN